VDIVRNDQSIAEDVNPWNEIKGYLATQVSAETFENWVSKTEFRESGNHLLVVGVPNRATKEFMEEEYGEVVLKAARDLNLPVRQILYQVSAAPASTVFRDPAANPAEVAFAFPGSFLNPRFTFEAFVVGSSNQFAHAAAHAVAVNPSRSYNPLFIYGGVGIGKTHLMHAIGRALLDTFAGMRIVYTSSERFMNEMIQCIKLDRMPLFHQHYRSADALLVDDIQILGGKERTQEEFFHTFNELYDHQKQIVISSDSSPKNMPGLVERLRSRFEWGLMVDIQPPDLETKMAILDKKSEAEGVRLPEDVRIFIATKVKSNVREMEGALIKLIAYSSVTDSPINLAMAQQALRHLVQNPDRRISIEHVIRSVAEKFSLQPSHLKQKSNARPIAYPRQVAMYLVKELTSASLPEIGRAFGGKHHTTVLYSIQKIERQRLADPDLNRLIHSVIDSFN
jgi:chromosomal replication initiator protein